jgi:hypothetical protein
MWPLFALSLKPMHRSPQTVQSYRNGIHQFATRLQERDRPTVGGGLTSPDLDGFIADILTKHKPVTAAARYPAPDRYFGCLVDED